MPVERDNFDQFTDTGHANRKCLTEMGVACIQAAQSTYDAMRIRKPTGNLYRSHAYNVADDHVTIGVTADYGGHVHNGTHGKPGRPWLRKAATDNAKSIYEAGARAWAGEMQ